MRSGSLSRTINFKGDSSLYTVSNNTIQLMFAEENLQSDMHLLEDIKDIPVAVIGGDDDFICNTVGLQKLFDGKLLYLNVLGAGHYVCFDNPKLCHDVIRLLVS